MKLVYHPKLATNFSAYGILIPLQDDRSSKTWDVIRQEFPGRFELVELEKIIPFTREDLERVHSQEFVGALLDEAKASEKVIEAFELVDENGNYNRFDPNLGSKKLHEMVDDVCFQGGASLFSMEQALKQKFCFFLGGGMHHGMENTGRGFCLINDIVIGLKKLLANKDINTSWVIDVDAHKGDGTAALTQNDQSIRTLSIHMKDAWPLDIGTAEDPWHLPSDVDIAIASGEEEDYVARLNSGLEKMSINFKTPDLVVIVAGADPYEKDQLPSTQSLKLSAKQMLERDLLIYNYFKDRNIPQCWLMAGGFGPFSWQVYSQTLSAILAKES